MKYLIILDLKRTEGDQSGHVNLFGAGSDYSTENFTYTNQVYDKLFNLMYFNTSCAKKVRKFLYK